MILGVFADFGVIVLCYWVWVVFGVFGRVYAWGGLGGWVILLSFCALVWVLVGLGVLVVFGFGLSFGLCLGFDSWVLLWLLLFRFVGLLFRYGVLLLHGLLDGPFMVVYLACLCC